MSAFTPELAWGLVGLTPLLLYAVLVFRDVDILAATAICVVLGGVLSHQTLVSFGAALASGMSSFLALVGLIIMLGRGLGEVLTATGVSQTIVHRIIYGIGVDSEKKAMLGIMTACMVIVGLLGTMAGGNAIIAPIVLPVAAAVGLSRSTVAVIFQAVGEEALILGPFTPPVVTLLGLTGLGYGEMLLFVSGPVALITLGVTWLMIQRIQRNTRETGPYQPPEETERFAPTARQRRATTVFALCFLAAVVYGIAVKAPTSFVIVIKPAIVVAGGFLGAFGISGATVATMKLLHEMFGALLSSHGVSMLAWALALVVATRVNNFVFPGANMASSLGFAESVDMKSMLRNGWTVGACQLLFLILYSLLVA